MADTKTFNATIMTLSYKPAIAKGQLHILSINGELIETTKEKDVLIFARSRITSKYDWKLLKEAVRLGEALTINTDN